MRRAKVLLVVLACAGALLSGCGDDDSSMSITGTSEPPRTTVARTTTTAEGAAGTTPSSASLAVATTKLGEIVVAGNGRSLYVFENDPPGMSTCTGSCLTTWPRYVPAAGTQPQGIEPRLVGTITVDGVQQSTLGGRPLYYFAGDRAPGDVNGQGVGGNWFAIRPNGEQVG